MCDTAAVTLTLIFDMTWLFWFGLCAEISFPFSPSSTRQQVSPSPGPANGSWTHAFGGVLARENSESQRELRLDPKTPPFGALVPKDLFSTQWCRNNFEKLGGAMLEYNVNTL